MQWPALEQLYPGSLRAVDFHFGRLLGRYALVDARAVSVAAALVSRAVGAGHTALDLAALGGAQDDFSLPQAIDGAALCACLRRETVVCSEVPNETQTPLLIDGDRLYLQRYWRYEQQLSKRVSTLIGDHSELDEQSREALDALFPRSEAGPDRQKLAVAIALTRSMSIITGGPGTGKTTTVARLLTLLAGRQPLQLGLAAPTGKAAARLSESLWQQLGLLQQQGMLSDVVRRQIPEQAMTLHRLLGARPGQSKYRYRADNPLPLDVLVVDEASMIDLSLMHALFDALPAHCRLILLGDRDQLCAVEAGNVFGELCCDAGRISAARALELRQWLGEDLEPDPKATPLSDAIGVLTHSYRFAASGGIGQLAEAVNRGDIVKVRSCLAEAGDELDTLTYAEDDMKKAIGEAARAYAPYLLALQQGAPDDDVLGLRARFQLLCALREGPQGVSGINQAIESELSRQGLIRVGRAHYPGRPVLVTRNDNALKLYNGDLGVLLPDDDDKLWACFVQPTGTVLRVAATRLPEHDTAFAMTVHKSQGSEFDHVMLLIPGPGSAARAGLIRRELLYTGITRARKLLTLTLSEGRFDAAWLARGVKSYFD